MCTQTPGGWFEKEIILVQCSCVYYILTISLSNEKIKKIKIDILVNLCYYNGGDRMSNEELNAIFGSIGDSISDIFDKDSSLYKETTLVNSIKSATKEDTLDPLTVALSEATHLDDKKDRYITLAKLYTSNMQKNIFRNQFDLNKEYPDVTIDEWNDFLTDRIVSVYINKHKRTLLKAAAEDNLANPIAKNKRDNLQLIRNIEEQEQSENNRNICIIRLPNIYDEDNNE